MSAKQPKRFVEYEEAIKNSRHIYDLAFCETLKRTTFELWEAVFHGWATNDEQFFANEADREYLRLIGSDVPESLIGEAERKWRFEQKMVTALKTISTKII